MLTPRDVADYLAPRYSVWPVERFGVMLLDAKLRVIRTAIVSTGTVDGSLVHPRDVYRVAALASAASVVVFHNHPTGDPTPSADDRAVTRRLQEAGELMGIELADHMILGHGTFFSFRERGATVKILYFDCFAGAAGDMIVGALLDAGLPFDELKRALGSLAVEGWDVSADRVLKTGVTATKFRVHDHSHRSPPRTPRSPHSRSPRSAALAHHPSHHTHHSLAEIESAIGRSALSAVGKGRAIAHVPAPGRGRSGDPRHAGGEGAPPRGGRHRLDHRHRRRRVRAGVVRRRTSIVASPLNVGGGMVRSAHGVFPVPAPATVRLLGKAPVYSSGDPGGAADADRRAHPHGVRLELRSGAGDAGGRASATAPAIASCRRRPTWCACSWARPTAQASAMRVVTMECEIDDMNPQIFGVLMDGCTRPARSRCSTRRCR